MPQDGPRSVVYRSFFSCDDPKGVVECKTNRKSKNDSRKLENKVEHQKKQKNLSMSFSFNEERKDRVYNGPTTDHELHNPSSYQLREVSRGAEKLNQVIDSWPKERSSDRHTRDIAEDLLRGALDLKESLSMLGKLQEASQIMAKLKKKPKEKAGGGKLDGMGIERTTSDRFGYQNHRTFEFQQPRLSVDGSSRDCYEELREVIRESFARQNLLPKSSVEEKVYSDRQKVCLDRPKADFSMDLPSTSSSQSSMFHSHEFDTSSDFSLSKSLEEKPKAPNVIAKLMGLDAIPPKPLQSNQQKHYGKDKAVNQGRTTFDVDLSKARVPHSNIQKVDPQQQTLEERAEAIQFKGLVTTKSVDRPQPFSTVSDWKKRFVYDSPPIVIIKPLHVSGLLEEQLIGQKYINEDLETKKMLRKWKMKEGLPPRPNNDQEGALKFMTEIHKKLRVEKSPVKRPIQEKGDKEFGDGFAKKDDKSVKILENLSSATVKSSAPVRMKQLSEKMVPKIQRGLPSTRKSIEADTAKVRDTSKSRGVNKLSSKNARKPVRDSNISKIQVSPQRVSLSDSISQYNTQTTSKSSTVRKKNVKNEKTISEPSTNLVEKKSKHDNIPAELGCGNEQDMTAKCMMPLEQLPSDEGKDASGNSETCNDSRSSLCESTEPIQPNNEITSTDDAKCGTNYTLNEMKSCQGSDALRSLLLDSSSFLNRAEELFDTHTHQSFVSHTTISEDYGMDDFKLLLECGKELLEHKSLQCRVTVHPFPHIHIKKSKICISLDRLMNEICDGIEYLRSYCKLAGKTIVVDTLQTVLQKDMFCKEAVNGVWDLGWRNGFTLDEIDQVVLDIEQKILSRIIEDLLMDMEI
ncbi:hypothetical protein ACH5RR_005980 [Cinchona calisaya]|uniref:DUF3741 domain-containing protein n=1 Tax=Cinchona calisaya TaxID=153742 RepID=A0ABD3AMY8_9GENT